MSVFFRVSQLSCTVCAHDVTGYACFYHDQSAVMYVFIMTI
jgi:hypothetical protein